MGGNPFAKSEGKEDLLAGGSGALRSDAPDWHDSEHEPAQGAAQPAGERAEAAAALEGARMAAETPQQQQQQQQQRGATAVAADGALPPPPPLVPAPPPGAVVSGTLYGDGSSAEGRPYYPPAPGASGAWGSGSYIGPAATAPTQPAGFPPPAAAGFPPPAGSASMGMYGISSDYQYAGAPPQAPAWTNTYPTDQQLAYTLALEQQAGGGPPQQKLACGGLGEQWTLFLVGILLWPLWYVACVWYCASKKQQADARYRTPFILNCVASTVFTVIWVAIVVRSTSGNCGTDASGWWYCW